MRMPLVVCAGLMVAGRALAADAVPMTTSADLRYAAQLEVAAETYRKAVVKCGYQPQEMWDQCRKAAETAYQGATGYAVDVLAEDQAH
ncbi:MAG: hypothetical protein EXR86_14950 [Gammaproteobacteria bacterium]|nr:hypothetical protein [Gammaproteobacteria bacterium]